MSSYIQTGGIIISHEFCAYLETPVVQPRCGWTSTNDFITLLARWLGVPTMEGIKILEFIAITTTVDNNNSNNTNSNGKGNGNGNCISNGNGKGNGNGISNGKGNGNGISNSKGNGEGDGNGNSNGKGNDNGNGNNNSLHNRRLFSPETREWSAKCEGKKKFYLPLTGFCVQRL